MFKARSQNKSKKKIINSLFSIEKINGEIWLETSNPMLVVKALDSYGEPYKRIIMEIVREHECLSYEIINKSGVPQASTYRRINELIENGFITEIKDDNPKLLGRHPSKYRSVVEKIDIFVGKEESVKFKFFDDHLEKSKIVGFLKESNSSISILN